MVIAIGNDGQFARFCQLNDRPEVAQDPRFVTNSARLANRDTLADILAGWLRTRSTRAWTDLLEPNAVPCAPILEVPEVFAHPQVIERGMKITQAGMPMIATPMRFDGVRPVADQPPPMLDEHGQTIRAALALDAAWPQR